MNLEVIKSVELRAAKHAALSEPARLRIVDLLTFGDLSPTEIRVALGMPANLVTHHLNMLEAVGMVTRSRSEADRRRSYVRLSPGTLDGLVPGLTETVSRVVFVCTANSARSQIAAALWQQQSSIPAASGGTHPADRVSPGAIAAAKRNGLDLSGGVPHALEGILTGTDFVVTVCDNAHEEVGLAGAVHWSIPDPVRVGTAAAFDRAYLELQRRITDLASRLAAS